MAGTEQKPAAMRESRDIEWLVHWTLVVQQCAPGNQVMSGAASGGLGWEDYGTRIDSSGHGAGLAGTLAHEDALTISDALGTMLADNLVREAAMTVIRYGRAGMQPDWGKDGCGRYVLQRRNNGKGRAVKRYRDQRQARGLLGFDWEWTGHSVETLEFMAIEWTSWREALVELRELVNPKLRRFVATGPMAPADPWDDRAFIAVERRGIDVE